MTDQAFPELAALGRLCAIALKGDSGQCRRVADFLLAWYDANENGKWDPTDLWVLGDTVANDVLSVLHLLRHERKYPNDLGFEKEIRQIWQVWRNTPRAGRQNAG